MCARFLRGENRFKAPRFLTIVSDWVETGLQRLSRFYGNALEAALTHRKTVLAFAVLILVISALLISMMGVIFLPPTDYSNIKMEMTVPGSYTFEQSKEKVREVENKIVEILNNNQVTSDEFQKIIDDLKKYKSKAYLIFQFLKIDDQSIDINNTREDHLFQIVGQDSDHSSILDHVTLR